MTALLLRFRTFLFALLALVCLLIGLYLCLRYPTAGIAIFTAFSLAVVGIVGAVATKSSIEHLAEGSGVKGALAALMTNAKPGDPPAPGQP